jgi:hypothetical protein
MRRRTPFDLAAYQITSKCWRLAAQNFNHIPDGKVWTKESKEAFRRAFVRLIASSHFQTHALLQSLGVAPSQTGLLGAFVLPNPGHEQLPDHS